MNESAPTFCFFDRTWHCERALVRRRDGSWRLVRATAHIRGHDVIAISDRASGGIDQLGATPETNRISPDQLSP